MSIYNNLEIYNILNDLSDNIEKIESNNDIKLIEEKIYIKLKFIFKSLFYINKEDKKILLEKIKNILLILDEKEKENYYKVNLNELNDIIIELKNNNLKNAEKLIWYRINKKSIYTVKVFDTERLNDEIVLKCAWYASLFEEKDAELIKRTKFYLFDKSNNKKLPLDIIWGENTYYKYDFPHEKIVNPYDNFQIVIDMKKIINGDYEIYYEIYGQNGKVIISNSAVSRKLCSKVLKFESYYKEIYFRISSRKIFINVCTRRKSLKSLLKIKLRKIKFDLKLIKRLPNKKLEIYFIYFFYKLIKLLYIKKIVLIGELPDSYEDSGSVLFQRLKTKKRKFKYYYITTKKELLKSDRKFIKFGGLRHKVLFLISDIVLNVQNIDLYMNPFMFRNDRLVAKRNFNDTLLYLAFSKYLIKQKRIFLQHGVLYQSGLTNAIYINSDFDYLVVSSEFEKKIFPDNARGFIESCLPRFSNYSKNNIYRSNKILFSPTWRKYFKDLSTGEIDIESIKKSKYYKSIIELITSEKLNNILLKYNYKLIYNVHHTMKDIIDKELIKINLMSNIEFKNKDQSLNDLIKECDICLTDYSSLFFDFLWQSKPVIHYINDYHDFHYREDNNKKVNPYFNLREHKGNICVSSLEDLCEKLEYIIRNYKNNTRNISFFNINNPCDELIKFLDESLGGKDEKRGKNFS